MIVNLFLAIAGAACVAEGVRRARRSLTLGIYLFISGVVAVLVALAYWP
jgi:hypothetical protein